MRNFIKQKIRKSLCNEDDIDEGLKSAALGSALALSTMMGGNLNANPNDIDNKPKINKTIESDKPIITLNGREIDSSLEDIIKHSKELKNKGYKVGVGKSSDISVAKKIAQSKLNNSVITDKDFVYEIEYPNEGYYYIIIKQ